MTLAAGGMTALRTLPLKPGNKTLTFNLGAKVKAKQAKVTVKLTDASGVSFTTVKKVNVPKTIKKKNGKGKRK